MKKPSYIDLINLFWAHNSEISFSREEIVLYFYLLHVCNRLHWPEQFQLYDHKIMEMTGLTREEILRARRQLKKRTLLCTFRTRNKTLTIYSVLDCYENSETEKCTKNAHVFAQNMHAFKKTDKKTDKENLIKEKKSFNKNQNHYEQYPKWRSGRRNPDPDDESLYCGREK